MKNNIKKVLKNRIFLCALTAAIFGTVGASAATYFNSTNVTYDNKESGLQSENVQGAIDELYNECFPKEPPTIGGTILENTTIVTSGDGLYEDTYEEDRYFYKGKNPNNYITFNNETWRIISIEPDKTIKIMSANNVAERPWDEEGGIRGSSNWIRPADLNKYLNETYLTTELSSTAQSQIIAKNWSIGAVTFGTIQDNYRTCQNTTWMFVNDDYDEIWTLTPGPDTSDYDGRVFSVYYDGSMRNEYPFSPNTGVRPALYLSSSVQITSGNGSSGNPYILSVN